MPEPDTTGPAFGKAPTHIHDVQLRHTLSPDRKANSIIFDNFSIRLLPGGPPIETRTLSILFPLTGIIAETPLVVNVRGDIFLLDGARAAFVFRMLGVTHVLDPLLSADESSSGDFRGELNLTVRAGDDLCMTFLLALERDATQPTSEGLLTVTTVDMAFASPVQK